MDAALPPEKWERLGSPGPNDINVSRWGCDGAVTLLTP
ncbi:hypothetical protein B0G75_1552 [Paraburkholderia sp. BL18I3N2]|nr:hypothetical protein B0G75_1552 [Paraburkholderia sp. BL18I3N2]PRX83391.1 hypothetical protein B0G73_1642 [Paraburkholderia sp. BL25I1N1]TDY17185.1 hypothetical protein B0G81_8419 [Paraburkholderia sp. BL6665CI2N2]